MSRATRARGRLAIAHRLRPDADHSGLRQELKAAKLADIAARAADQIVAARPELTPEQLADIAALLRPAIEAGADAA